MDKARINRARRAAARQGFTLRRSRTPDPLALDFGWHVRKGQREVARFRELDELERWLAGWRGQGAMTDACLSCRAEAPRMVTDHCHKHSRERGRLCIRCNSLMAWIDRGMAPKVSPPVTLAGLVAYAARCPDCPPLVAGDLGPARPLHYPVKYRTPTRSRSEEGSA